MRPGTLGDSDTENEASHTTRPSTSRRTNPMVRIAPTSRLQKSSESKPRGAAKRKMTYRQKEMKQLREIAKLQLVTKLMIPRAPFSRVIREISLSFNSEITHYTTTALEALQEATEMYLTQVLSDSYLLTLHRKCVTLSVADVVLLRALKLDL